MMSDGGQRVPLKPHSELTRGAPQEMPPSTLYADLDSEDEDSMTDDQRRVLDPTPHVCPTLENPL